MESWKRMVQIGHFYEEALPGGDFDIKDATFLSLRSPQQLNNIYGVSI